MMRCTRTTFTPSPLCVLAVLLMLCSVGCASSSSQGDGKQSPSASSQSNQLPEITEETIRKEINNTRVRQVPEENGASEPISWSFDYDEPKEFTVIDKQMEGEQATIVIDIKTRSAPDAREQRYLAGQIRLHWVLESGWVMRQWEIDKTENISMKYRNLPKPPDRKSGG